MKNKILNLSFIIFLGFFYSCSNTKYKGVKQYYVNFVSYYNTYFNIKQRYKIGYREATLYQKENVNDILAVFEYDNDLELFKNTAQFNETAIKVSKLMTLRPNNKWMDDALYIQGKIKYLKGDYDSAIFILNYVVENYPKGYINGHLPANKLKKYDEMVKKAETLKEPISQPRFKFKFAKNDATIWLIKAMIKRKQYEQAETVIAAADADMSFPLEYRKDLKKAELMLLIIKKNYKKADEKLLKLIDEEKLTKKELGRMYFILAQINEKLNQLEKASIFYDLALEKGKLNEGLEFEAILKKLSYSEKNLDASLSKLSKMKNKGKYEKSLDKIYLAIGDVYLKKKNMPKALANFQLALSNATTSSQKFYIFEKIANINYDNSNYVLAAAYYDSASLFIPENYPNKAEFLKKALSLKSLLTHYSIFYEKDSILTLANLGEDKAKNQIIKSLRKELENRKLEAESDNNKKAQDLVKSNSKSTPGQWYFSTPENIEKGRLSFQKKWGKLALTDFWYKGSASQSNNSTNNTSSISNSKTIELTEQSIDFIAEIESKRLPFSDQEKKPMVTDIQKALMSMGRIYNFEIKDIQKAIETYELLFNKYPDSIENEDEALYLLFRLYKEKEKLTEAEIVLAKLTSKYPNSKYSLYAINPNAKSDDEKNDQLVFRRYKDAYLEYKKANYEVALQACDLLETNFPNHSLTPKIKLLKAFIYSYTLQSELFLKYIEDLTTNYSKTEEGIQAQEFLDLINKKEINVKKSHEESLAPNQSIKNNLNQSFESKLADPNSAPVENSSPEGVQDNLKRQ